MSGSNTESGFQDREESCPMCRHVVCTVQQLRGGGGRRRWLAEYERRDPACVTLLATARARALCIGTLIKCTMVTAELISRAACCGCCASRRTASGTFTLRQRRGASTPLASSSRMWPPSRCGGDSASDVSGRLSALGTCFDLTKCLTAIWM
jgi:hypothetical protein